MGISAGFDRPAQSTEIRAMLRQLQSEAIIYPLLPLYVLGLILLWDSSHFSDPLQAGVSAALLFLLPLGVGSLRRGNYLASAWTLVIGCLLINMLLIVWGQLSEMVFLLALPTGLAMLFIGTGGGAATAVGSTALLLGLPASGYPLNNSLVTAALIGVWGTAGIVWLTSHPLLTTMRWLWSEYEQNRDLLEQSRDYQLQLKQALEDLAHNNAELQRLNRLARGMREIAEEARKAKEQFVANVSHELRTPLNMIVGFSQMIVQAPETYGSNIPPALLADLDVVLRNSQHLSSLIDDVLDLSQIDTGQMALTRERVALGDLIESAAVAVRPLFDSKELYLQTESSEALPLVYCDRTRIREVVLNLLSNAGRFTEVGGVIVRAWQEGSDVVVSVADSGPGIQAADAEKLFQPFQQLDGSIRHRYGGSGLGLCISRSFVEMHSGKMWFESRQGHGTTFFFRLPIDPLLPADPSTVRWRYSLGEHDGRKRLSQAPVVPVLPRFVILEAGNSLQRLLSRYEEDLETVRVQTIEQAAQELARRPAHALLVNETATGNALQRISSSPVLPYGIPAIVCSIPGDYEAAYSLGVSDYLVKPISRERLLAALDRLKLNGGTVLIADDEPDALRLFRRMLTSSGRSFRVLRATNGRQALNILHTQRPDAVLLDLVMPEMDGFQLLEAKNQDPTLREVPVIVTSARDPAGHPIISNALAVTRGGGLSVSQILTCVKALTGILSPLGQPDDPARPAGHSG